MRKDTNRHPRGAETHNFFFKKIHNEYNSSKIKNIWSARAKGLSKDLFQSTVCLSTDTTLARPADVH